MSTFAPELLEDNMNAIKTLFDHEVLYVENLREDSLIFPR